MKKPFNWEKVNFFLNIALAILIVFNLCSCSSEEPNQSQAQEKTFHKKSGNVGFTFEQVKEDGAGTDALFFDGVQVPAAKILCATPASNNFGHAVTVTGGKYYIVYWHTDKTMLPDGDVTQYNSAYGGVRFMVAMPISKSDVPFLCGVTD